MLYVFCGVATTTTTLLTHGGQGDVGYINDDI